MRNVINELVNPAAVIPAHHNGAATAGGKVKPGGRPDIARR